VNEDDKLLRLPRLVPQLNQALSESVRLHRVPTSICRTRVLAVEVDISASQRIWSLFAMLTINMQNHREH
jgi:hypothetical protein